MIGMLFPSIDVNHVSKAWLTFLKGPIKLFDLNEFSNYVSSSYRNLDVRV